MKKSALQKARANYQPKLPIVLTGAVKAVEGKPTTSVADQDEIKKLFPNTYGLPELKFEKNPNPGPGKPLNVGVILSGGQAPAATTSSAAFLTASRKYIATAVSSASSWARAVSSTTNTSN